MKSLIGKLRCVIASREDCACDHDFFFEAEDGETWTVTESRSGCLNDIPLETRIEVLLDGEVIAWWQRLDEIARQMGETRKDIALVRVVSEPAQITPEMERLTERAARHLEKRWRRLCGERWEVLVTPYVMAADCIRTVQGNCWHLMRAHADQVNPGHQHNYWHGWGGTRAGMCGHAFMNHSRAWTFENCGHPGTQTEDTQGHEQGHNFALGHTGATPGGEYGERTLMGAGAGRGGLNGPQIAHLGLMEPESIRLLEPDASERHFLIRADRRPSDLRPGEYKLVKVYKTPNAQFAIARWGNMVRVYRPEPRHARNWAWTWVAANLSVGTEATVDEGVQVRYVALQDGAAEVVVKWDATLPEPPDREFPEPLLPDDAPPLTTAIWHHPGWNHQGIDLHVLQSRGEIAGYWYTWDEGRLRWYLLQGPIRGNVAELEIWTTQNRQLVRVGHGHLYQHDGGHGVIRYWTAEHDRGSIPLTRLSTAVPHELYGIWKAVGRAKEGLSLTVSLTEDGTEQIAGYWYGYDPPPGHARPAPQRWLHLSGTADDLTIYRAKGGEYNLGVDSDLEVWGIAYIADGVFRYQGTELGQFGLARLA